MDKDRWQDYAREGESKARGEIYTPYIETKEWIPNEGLRKPELYFHKNVLDYGCGLGRNFPIYKDSKMVYGYDLPDMIVLCRQVVERDNILGDVPYKLIPAPRIEHEIEQGSIDTIICDLVLQHMTADDIILAMYHWCYALADDGVIVANTRNTSDWMQKTAKETLMSFCEPVKIWDNWCDSGGEGDEVHCRLTVRPKLKYKG